MAELLGWTREALGRAHLVQVAWSLHRELALGLDALGALRIPTDLLTEFPHWRRGSTAGFSPRSLGLAPVPEAAGQPLRTIRLQVAPSTGATSILLTLLADLRRRLDPAAGIVVLVDPDADIAGLRRLARLSTAGGRRVRWATVDFPTIFARDNAVAARDARGRSVLLVPRALRTEWESAAEPLDARAAERRLGLRVARSRLHWHGGNIQFDGECLAVGADVIAENVTRLGLAPHEVVALLVAELGRDVVVLGDPTEARFDHVTNRVAPSAQASYHIDLDVMLLGRVGRARRPTALLADPRQGLASVHDVVADRRLAAVPHLPAPHARQELTREYRLAARQREPALHEYRKRLVGLGYRVVDVPDLRTRGVSDGPFGSGDLDFIYCNVLPGLNRGRAAVHYLPWGVPSLDQAAARSMRAADVRPIRVSITPYLARAMMQRAAGLRCFCGTMP